MKRNQSRTVKHAVLGMSLSLLTASLAFQTVHAQKTNVAAGTPILNGFHARIVCPSVAAGAAGKWTGNFNGRNSTCEVETTTISKPATPVTTSRTPVKILNIKTGTIWNKLHASKICTQLATKNNGIWKGKWNQSPASCQIEVPVTSGPVAFTPKPATPTTPTPATSSPTYKMMNIIAGNIWSKAHADNRCKALAKTNKGTWTGTYVSRGKSSTCQIRVAVSAPVVVISKPTTPTWRGGKNVTRMSAGTLNNQWNATQKCQAIATRTGGTWTGNWTKSTPGVQGTCAIRLKKVVTATPLTPSAPRPTGTVRTVNAGPIWDQSAANRKCPIIANNIRGTWTGVWNKINYSTHASTCQVQTNAGGSTTVYVPTTPTPTVFTPRPVAPAANIQEIYVGPVWDQTQANKKCQLLATSKNGVWTGNWRKTNGHNSVCSIRF